MAKYVLQTVLAETLPRRGAGLHARKEPWGERGIEGFQVRYLEMGGLRHTGWFHFKLNPCHQRWCSKLASWPLHPSTPLLWGGLKALTLVQECWFGHWLPTFPSTAPYHPSFKQPGCPALCLLSVVFLRQKGVNAVNPQSVPVLLLLSEEPRSSRCLLAAPLGSAWCGCKVEGRVDVTPDYTGEQ